MEILKYILEDSYNINIKELYKKITYLTTYDDLLITIKKILISNNIYQIYKSIIILNYLLKYNITHQLDNQFDIQLDNSLNIQLNNLSDKQLVTQLKKQLDKNLEEIVNILLQINNEIINFQLLNLLYNIVIYLIENINLHLLNLILININRIYGYDLLKYKIIIKIYHIYTKYKLNLINITVLYNILNSISNVNGFNELFDITDITGLTTEITDVTELSTDVELKVKLFREEIYNIIYKINPIDNLIYNDINYLLYLLKLKCTPNHRVNTLNKVNGHNNTRNITVNMNNIYNLLLKQFDNGITTTTDIGTVIEILYYIIEILNKDLFLLQINFIITILNKLFNNEDVLKNFSGSLYKLLKIINNKCIDFNYLLNINKLKIITKLELNGGVTGNIGITGNIEVTKGNIEVSKGNLGVTNTNIQLSNDLEDILLLYVYINNDMEDIKEIINILMKNNIKLRNDEIYLNLLNYFNYFDEKLLYQFFHYIKQINLYNHIFHQIFNTII